MSVIPAPAGLQAWWVSDVGHGVHEVEGPFVVIAIGFSLADLSADAFVHLNRPPKSSVDHEMYLHPDGLDHANAFEAWAYICPRYMLAIPHSGNWEDPWIEHSEVFFSAEAAAKAAKERSEKSKTKMP